jgi:hypothetical protein
MAAQDLASRSVFAVNAHGSADAQKGRGKGLGWSDDENLALCRAAAFVSQDSIMGASMRQVQYARRIRGAFIKDLLRPADSCSQDGTDAPSIGRAGTARRRYRVGNSGLK